MNRDKQIEEMAELIYKETSLYNIDTAYDISTVLHDAGYRKSEEVAREIFEEIEDISADFPLYGNTNTVILSERDLAFIKKKYTEDTE